MWGINAQYHRLMFLRRQPLYPGARRNLLGDWCYLTVTIRQAEAGRVAELLRESHMLAPHETLDPVFNVVAKDDALPRLTCTFSEANYGLCDERKR